MQKKFDIGSAAMHKINHLKKLVCHWVPYNLTEHQKAEHVKFSKVTLKLLKDSGHCIISIIIIGDEIQ